MRCKTTFTGRLVGLLVGLTLMGITGCDRSSEYSETTVHDTERLSSFDFLIDWQAEPTYLGVYYAKHIGAFEDLGLDVNIIQTWGANETASAIAAGRYLIGTSSGGATAIANSHGANLISTGVLYHRLPTVVFGLARTGIQTPQDLEGKNVGVYSQSITVNEFDAFLSLADVDREKVNVVGISGPDLPLIRSGRVDAVLNYFELSPTQLAMENDTFSIFLRDFGVDAYGLNIITSRIGFERQREKVQGITEAVLRGYREGCSSPREATQAFLTMFPEKDPNFVEKSWALVCDWIDGRYGEQTIEGWERTIDLYSSQGLLSTPISPENILPPE